MKKIFIFFLFLLISFGSYADNHLENFNNYLYNFNLSVMDRIMYQYHNSKLSPCLKFQFFNSYKLDKNIKITFYELNINNQEEENFISYFNNANTFYNIFNNNCAQFISKALENNNFKKQSNVMTPSGLEELILNDNLFKYRIKKSYTFDRVIKFNNNGYPVLL